MAPTAPDITQPANLPITGDSAGTQTTLIDIDFHSQNVPAGGLTATITYAIGGGGDQVIPVPLAVGQTPSAAASAITAAIDSVIGLGAAKLGTQITVTPDDTVVLSKLTLAIA